MEKQVVYYDVVIIGAGAAGLSAAIYAGRARLKTLIIEKALVGGLATYTNEIENYPGFPDGITGLELMNLFKKQAEKFGVQFKLTDVKSIDFSGSEKIIETFRNKFIAKAVVVATGGKPRLTGAKGEDLFLYDKGISFCATCDAAANTDKTVIVVGSGDAAIEEGLFLTKFAKKVQVIVMHDEGIMDCNEIAKAQALANPKIEFVWHSVVEEFKGEERLNSIVVKDLKSGNLNTLHADSCFLFIGYLANTNLFKGVLDMTQRGTLLANDKMESNIDGVFIAGDVRERYLNQVATAVGDGAIAGVSCEKYLAESEIYEHQIINEGKRSLVFVYNATDNKSKELLRMLEDWNKDNPSAHVVKVDTYKSSGLANRLKVENNPCLVLVKDKQIQKISNQIDNKILDSFLQL